jgi:hypothetical protein
LGVDCTRRAILDESIYKVVPLARTLRGAGHIYNGRPAANVAAGGGNVLTPAAAMSGHLKFGHGARRCELGHVA